jgi:hypothetical protein
MSWLPSSLHLPTTVRVGLLSALVALTILASHAALGAAQQNQRESEVRALVEEKINVNGPGVAMSNDEKAEVGSLAEEILAPFTGD